MLVGRRFPEGWNVDLERHRRKWSSAHPQPTSLEVQGWGEGRPWFQPDLPLTGTVTQNSSTSDNMTAECDAVGDGGGGQPYVPPPPDCGTRPIQPIALKLEAAGRRSCRSGWAASAP